MKNILKRTISWLIVGDNKLYTTTTTTTTALSINLFVNNSNIYESI